LVLRDKPEDDKDGRFVEKASLICICIMTKLLDQAIEAVRKLPPRAQDEVADAMIASRPLSTKVFPQTQGNSGQF
jgi:hypothetical protein